MMRRTPVATRATARRTVQAPCNTPCSLPPPGPLFLPTRGVKLIKLPFNWMWLLIGFYIHALKHTHTCIHTSTHTHTCIHTPTPTHTLLYFIFHCIFRFINYKFTCNIFTRLSKFRIFLSLFPFLSLDLALSHHILFESPNAKLINLRANNNTSYN